MRSRVKIGEKINIQKKRWFFVTSNVSMIVFHQYIEIKKHMNVKKRIVSNDLNEYGLPNSENIGCVEKPWIENLKPNQYYFKYALGVVTGMVIIDGLVLAIPIGIFMFFSNKKYHWYQWLNMLAYSTIFSRLFFGFLNNL